MLCTTTESASFTTTRVHNAVCEVKVTFAPSVISFMNLLAGDKISNMADDLMAAFEAELQVATI